MTNKSWAPTGGRPADGDATKFDEAGKAPGWLGIGGQAISGGLRLLVGKLKDVPVLGNVLNFVDAGVDAISLAGKLITGKGTPQERAKNAADLVMHTIGIFKPSVGADYDKGQGRMRLAIAGAEAGAKILGIDIPPEMRQWTPVLAAGYGVWSGFTPRNEDGSEQKPALGAWSTLAIAAGGAWALPKVKNLLTGGN
ncbi:MAG: hypothetical protein JNK82_13415 [Myxococcaceae bacterium]|nr:hypothetical protein [Myxococcaceae bacterium]